MAKKFETINRKMDVVEPLMFDKIYRGTVVADFERLLSYITEQNGIFVGERNSLFVMKTLPTLNALLTNPIVHNLQRPLQKNFPHLHALNALLRFSGLAYVEQKKKESILHIHPEAYRSWNSLNEEEKYCNLLPIMFLDEIAEALDEHLGFRCCSPCLTWLIRAAGQERRFETYKEQQRFAYTLSHHQLGFFDLFGFLSITRAQPEEGCGWRFTSVCPTPFGLAMCELLLKNNKSLCLERPHESIVEMRNIFQTVLAPYIPAWKHNLLVYHPEERHGAHLFKISLQGSWKIIAIDPKETLSTLAYVIIKEFNFDMDGGYYFIYKDKKGIPIKISQRGRSETQCFTDDSTIASLNLAVGQPMTFLFDFREKWEFKLQLEQCTPPGLKIEQATLIKSGGAPVPKQYASNA